MTDKKTIICPGLTPKCQIMFAQMINEAFAEGYVISTEDSMSDFPRFVGRPTLTMIKASEVKVDSTEEKEESAEGEIEVSVKPDAERSVEDILEDKKASKEECIELAAKLGIELPESAKAPLAIKKVIKEKLAEQKPEGEAPV